MTITLIEHLKQHLVSQGLITAANCFIDFYEDSQVDTITLTQYGGRPEQIFNEQNISVQIKACSVIPKQAKLLLESIYQELIDRTGYKIIDGIPCIIVAKTDIMFLNQENSRYNYVFNVNISANRDQ